MVDKIKIGWIGTGVMGFSMCKHIIKAGYSVMVSNRTMSKTDGLVELGAKASDPISIAKEVDFLFLMLGYPKDVEEMVFNEDKGILKHLKKGSYLVDHTTSSPKLSEKLYEECKKIGVHSYDVPVTGGDVGAREGRLISLVGGDAENFSSLEILLKIYSREIRLLGGAGYGQHTKMVNQIFIASNIIGVCEGLLYSYKAGLDLEKTLEILLQGAGSSTQLNVYGPRLLKKDYEAGFFADHFVKDMDISLEESERMGLDLKGLKLARSFFKIMLEDGLGRKGHHGVFLTLEKLNKMF